MDIEVIGFIGVITIIVLLVLIPLIMTLILGAWVASMLHLSGLVWWAFMVIFFLVISSLINMGR